MLAGRGGGAEEEGSKPKVFGQYKVECSCWYITSQEEGFEVVCAYWERRRGPKLVQVSPIGQL